MSIIYDALQKTQENRKTKKLDDSGLQKPLKVKKDFPWIKIGKIILILLSIIVIVEYYLLIKKHYEKINSVKPQVLLKPQVQMQPQVQIPPKVIKRPVLNGVFLSEQFKIALMNNQYYSIGDSIDGMKIVSIDLNSVKLQDGNQIIVVYTSTL